MGDSESSSMPSHAMRGGGVDVPRGVGKVAS
jgi:hypothetical protein